MIQSSARRPSALPFRMALGVLLGAVTVTACTVGPDFKRPSAPSVSRYTDEPLSSTVAAPNVAGGEAQQFIPGGRIPGDWWALFHSRPLNELIDQALTNNPDLKAAQAALSAARQEVLEQRGAYYPSVAASFAAVRQRQSEQLAPTPNANVFEYSLFTPQVSVS